MKIWLMSVIKECDGSHIMGAFRPAHRSCTSSTLPLREPKITPCYATLRLTDIIEPALKARKGK